MEHSIDFNGPIEKQALIYIKYNFRDVFIS